MTEPIDIRDAHEADLAAINDIYNHYVLHSTATYQNDPDTLADRQTWFGHHGPKHPVTVAERGGRTVGWGSLSPFRERAAYAHTVENSVYVHHECHRQGIGRAILVDLIERARKIGHHTIIAGIDGEQAASIAIHSGMGFVKVAHLTQVGYKYGRWLDVHYMQLMLAGAGDKELIGSQA